MKKHFLILMLMALLPMAGFALSFDESKFYCLNIDYGTATLPNVQTYGGSSYTEGTHYEVVAGKFYNEAKEEIAVTSLATTNKGKYYRKVTGLGDYEGQTIYVDFWINGIDADLTITGGYSKTFGQADPELEFTLVKHGTETAITDAGLTITRATGEDVKEGGYAFTITCTNPNYDVTRADANVFTINPKAIGSDVVAPATPATITEWQGNVVYTGNDIIGVYTVKDGTTTLVADKDYTVSAATTVADYRPTITFKGNYSGTITVDAEHKFSVTPAPIVVGVENIEKVYDGTTDYGSGVEIPYNFRSVATFTYSGFVGADAADAATLKGKFVTTDATVYVKAAEAINAGDYELVIAGVDASNAALSNYEIKTYMPGKLTIKKKPLAIKAQDAEKAVGEADPAFEIVPVAGLTITGVTFTREDGETAGDYAITPNVDAIVIKKGDKVVTTNYAPTADATGKLTIGKPTIYVAIKDAKKFYGAADPTYEYTVTGLRGTDKLTAEPTFSRNEGEKPGSYAVTATVANPNADKYDKVVVANGILTINKAQLQFTMGTMSVVKDATEAQQTAALDKALVTVTGIKNSDAKNDLFTLSWNGVDFTTNNTNPTGVKATLDNSLTEGAKKLLTEGGRDYYAAELYEIVDEDGNKLNEGLFTTGKVIVGEGSGSTETLDLVDDATAADKIAAAAGETFRNVTIKFAARDRGYSATATETFPWKAEKWTTMVLPFDITVAELSKALGYAIVNVINPEKTVVSGAGSEFWGKVTMKGGNGNDTKLAANKPFMLKIDDDLDATKFYDFGKQTIVAPSDLTVDAGKGVKFTGTYAAKTVTKADNAAIWFMNGNEDGWQYIGASSSASWTIAPFEAYIDMSSASASAPNMTFFFEEIDGTVTAIKSINAENLNKNMSREGWYNLNGVKLQGAPTQKGIYIQNGKKVVVK